MQSEMDELQDQLFKQTAHIQNLNEKLIEAKEEISKISDTLVRDARKSLPKSDDKNQAEISEADIMRAISNAVRIVASSLSGSVMRNKCLASGPSEAETGAS